MTEKIGDYNILKKIGAGGMAQVFLAVHQDVPNLKVVLKILSDPRLVERFKQEADKLALLDGNGHICQIKHFFNHGDEIVIAMEYIDGSSLEEMIKNEEKLGIETSLQIISEVLDTLSFAHQKGVYHRDIKPGNIMVDKSGHVKIIDFGIAKGESDPNLTVAGSSCGTPTYMPPEQFNPTDAINYSLADIYAVGSTLFHMLTGRLPFTGDNAFALRDAKLFNDPVSPRSLNSAISKQLEELILKSINREPEDRFESVESMKAAIENLGIKPSKADLTEHVVPSLHDTPKPTASTSHKKKSGLNPLWLIGGAVLIVFMVVLYFIIGGDGPLAINPPVLSTPTYNDTIEEATPLFTWEGMEGYRYTLELSDDENFSSPQSIGNLEQSDYRPDIEMADGKYFWRVQAEDGERNKSIFSKTAVFTIVTLIDTIPIISEGILEITIKPYGNIKINSQSFGNREKSKAITLESGQHIVELSNSQSKQKRYTDTVDIIAEQTYKLSRTFTMLNQLPEKSYGDILIGSKPYHGAVIFIDGKLQEKHTPYTFRVETGERVIKAVLDIDGVTHEKTETIRVKKNGSHKLIFDFEK
ncbi:MAG: serine/threonine protein kinase [candidate division Zixibacteria bacterium]|nr:serine/threonine protein kinase [candidate division Zixibacteria bacterium]